MDQNGHSWTTNFNGSIADDVLRDLPYAWVAPVSVKTGYEISFTRYFYKPQPLRTLAEIRADILAVEQETEGLMDQILAVELAA